jgi:hypothetical protein
VEQITASKSRTTYTVRLNPEMYDVLARMSEETGLPLSTLVDRGLGIGLEVSAKLEVGQEAGWLAQSMTARPVRLTVQQPAEQVAKAHSWSSRVFALSGNGPVPIEDFIAQGERHNKGEL